MITCNVLRVPPKTERVFTLVVSGAVDQNMSANAAGTGTFGRVVLVQHSPTTDFFALKMLTISEVLKLKQVDHVKNEKEVLSSVRHPFIVNLYVHQSVLLLFTCFSFLFIYR